MKSIRVFVLCVFLAHTARWCAEYLYWTYCARSFFMSFVSYGSPMCETFRRVAHTNHLTIVDVAGRGLGLLTSR